jgi:hypothetical protein
VLSDRLAALVKSGIMERREYRDEGQLPRIEDPLTRMGQALGLPFMAMTAWADKGLGDGTSLLTLRSRSTGQRLSVALVDERGKRYDANALVRFDPDPSVAGGALCARSGVRRPPSRSSRSLCSPRRHGTYAEFGELWRTRT